MIPFLYKLQSFSRTTLGTSEAKFNQNFTGDFNRPIIGIIYEGSSCSTRQKLSLSLFFRKSLLYSIPMPRSRGFQKHQNKLAQYCTKSVNKNNTVTMRTVLTINFFFLFLKSYHSFKKQQGFILIKKMNSQCEIPAMRKTYRLVSNYLPGTFAN